MKNNQEPRPTPVSVFADTATSRISEWLQAALKPLPLEAVKQITDDLDADDPDKTIHAMLLSAGQQSWQMDGTLDAYRMARAFDDTLDWPVNGKFAAILQQAVDDATTTRLMQVTREWVMRTGIRFPAKADDEITFKTPTGARTGKVITVEKGIAAAQVSFFASTMKATVFAEDVIRRAG